MSRIVSVVNQWIKRYIFVVEIIFLSHQLKVSTHEKKIFFAAMMLLATTGAFAQGNGIGGITEATNMVTSYFESGTKTDLCHRSRGRPYRRREGLFQVFLGDPDTSKTAASWFGACIFLIVAATILRSFFL